jgi:pimeloyl-ACP methyl ester carboxylesterase
MGTAHNYDQLAKSLAADFTVYVPDRRGRGMSPRPYTPDHRLQRDVEDLDSVLSETGAEFVFGLSSGAIIAVESARVLGKIRKAAIYEPPFYVKGVPSRLIARVNREIDRRDFASALVTVNQIVKLGPGFIPRPIFTMINRKVLRDEKTKGTGGYASLQELIPAMRYDFRVVSDSRGDVEPFRAVQAEILLLGGTKSPRYLKDAMATLEKILPRVHRTEFQGLDHSGPWNSDRGGDPEIVAQSLYRFFSAR